MRICAALALVLVAGLYGCSGIPDLKESRDIPDADRAAANRLAQLITSRCRYERRPKRGFYLPPVALKFEQLALIRRLYSSPSGWYKAEYSADGVDGIAYDNAASGTLVCGEALWQNLRVSSTVHFTEVGRK